MATTFDGPNKLIILGAPTAGVLNVDVEKDLYSAWKVWVTTGDNSKYLPAFRGAGGDPLTPGVEAGAYFFLRNDLGWRIISSDADQTINYQGNLVGESAVLPIINVTPTRSVLHLGLQPVTQRVDEILTQSQKADYDGAVWVDTISGTSGTAYPSGTSFAPVANLSDALVIASGLGFRKINLIGVITLTQAFNFWSFEGKSAVAEINVNGQDISGSEFDGIGLFGNCPAMFERAVLTNGRVSSAGLFNYRGIIANSVLAGNLSLQTGDHALANIASDIPGAGRPYIDVQGNNVNVSVRGYLGGLEIRNFSHASADMSVDVHAGAVRVLNTCTSGTIVVRGIVSLDDQSAGTTIITAGMVSADDLHLMRQLLAGRAVVSGDDLTITVYDEDDVTVLQTFSVSADGRIRTPI